MGDMVMLLTGAAMVAVGIGFGTRAESHDWLDGGRQKIVQDYGVTPDFRSVSNSFPINAMNYVNVENSEHWATAPERSRRTYVLNAADSADGTMNQAAAYDIVMNDRRRNTKRYGIRYPFM
jgi:hypothetical protein